MLKDFDKIEEKDLENIRIEANYHTHNYLCKHAKGNVSDYVGEAVRQGLVEIGISDHACVLKSDNRPYLTKKTLENEYLPQFAEAEKMWGKKIQIRSGVEIEYYPGMEDYYRYLLSKVDYLVLGQHEYSHKGEKLNSFAKEVKEEEALSCIRHITDGIESGFFSVCAHPDVILGGLQSIPPLVDEAFRRLIRKSIETGVPVEWNANGIRSNGFRYPTDYFVEVCKEEGADVIVSSDAHKPEVLCDSFMKRLVVYAKQNGFMNTTRKRDVKRNL